MAAYISRSRKMHFCFVNILSMQKCWPYISNNPIHGRTYKHLFQIAYAHKPNLWNNDWYPKNHFILLDITLKVTRDLYTIYEFSFLLKMTAMNPYMRIWHNLNITRMNDSKQLSFEYWFDHCCYAMVTEILIGSGPSTLFWSRYRFPSSKSGTLA